MKSKRLSKAEKNRRRAARPLTQTGVKKLNRIWKNKNLKEWSVEILSVGKCAVCGSTVEFKRDEEGDIVYSRKTGRALKSKLDAHHLLPKERYPEFKFLPINGVALCPTHHKYGRFSAHRNPIWFSNWLREYRPEQYRWAKANMGEDPCQKQS